MYTFSKFFDAYVRKFLNLLDEQILLVALKNQCCAALTTTLKAEFAQGVFNGLWYVYGVGLHQMISKTIDYMMERLTMIVRKR
jgi:hypothetical protein